MPRFAYGGQALMEGVMMRGRDAIAVAVRHPDGGIVTATEQLDSILHRSRFARAPLFRGIVLLYETLVVGTRWLMRSGSIAAAGEGVEMGRGAIAVTLIVTFGFAIGLFVILPLFSPRRRRTWPSVRQAFISTSSRGSSRSPSSWATCWWSAERRMSLVSSDTTAPST
jgi:uncharacterized protein YqhQ